MRRYVLTVLFTVVMVLTMVTSLAAAPVIYSSSYVIAGYGAGVGSMPSVGQTYGFYGGIIPSSLGLKGCSVTGRYNEGLGRFVVTYTLELENPSTEGGLICRIPFTNNPDVDVKVSVVPLHGSSYNVSVDSRYLTTYNSDILMYGLNYTSDVPDVDAIPGASTYVADARGLSALSIHAVFGGKTVYNIIVTIEDSNAVIKYPYQVDSDSVMLFPFEFLYVETPVILSLVTTILGAPYMTYIVSIAVSVLLISIVLKFMG